MSDPREITMWTCEKCGRQGTGGFAVFERFEDGGFEHESGGYVLVTECRNRGACDKRVSRGSRS